MNCTCVVCTDMLLFYLSAGSSAKNQDMGHEGETGSSRCSSCFLKSVITSKAECPNLGLVKYSPGWKTQQLARLILTVDWSSEIVANCASTLVHFVSRCMLTGQTKQFTNTGTLEMLSELTAGCLDATLQNEWFATLVRLLGPQDMCTTNNLMQHCIRENVNR